MKTTTENRDNFTYGEENRVISYHKIRRAVGIIGMLLPFGLWSMNALINESEILNHSFWITFEKPYLPDENLKDSISHFYYAAVGELFTGALCAVSLFLFCYRGYSKPKSGKYCKIPGDSFMTNFAGLMALLVVIFPTSSKQINDNFRVFVASETTGYIHYLAAALFFITLSVISFVNFRRTKHPEDFGKMKSHNIYRNCALIMMSCMIVLIIIFILEKTTSTTTFWAEKYNVTYWLETIMLLAFGISWVVKGEIDQRVLNKNIFGNGIEK